MKTLVVSGLRLTLLVLLAVITSGCGAAAPSAAVGPASSVTITMDGSTCTYGGPSQIHSAVDVNTEVMGSQEGMDYYIGVVALDSGKALEDLKDLIGTDADGFPPSWVTVLRFVIMVQSTSTQPIDLTANSAFTGQPVYFVCFARNEITGAIGPLKVVD
jgi:hypothetical protein